MKTSSKDVAIKRSNTHTHTKIIASNKCTKKVSGTVDIDPKPIAELDDWSDGNVYQNFLVNSVL